MDKMVLMVILLLSACSATIQLDVSNPAFDDYKFSSTSSASNGDIHLRIKKTSNNLSEELASINLLYRTTDSPYSGAISNQIVCDQEFKPSKEDGIILAYANDRLTYGGCSWDLVSYRALIYIVDCDRNSYKIEWFIPIGQDMSKYKSEIKNTVCTK